MPLSRRPESDPPPPYVDTPRGLFTAEGVWFRATESSLRTYAGEVLEREPLPALLGRAARWLRSPQTLALWALPLLLMLAPPLAAALATVVLYVGWACVGPAFVLRWMDRLWRVLESVAAQLVYYTATLSVLGWMGQTAAVWVGLGGFIVLRWGLLQRLAAPLIDRIRASIYPLPVADQVLRSVIVRAALKHRVALPELEPIERSILENWTKHDATDSTR